MVWKEREVNGHNVEELEKAGESPLMARLLDLRGVTLSTLETFFNPSFKNLLPPGELPGIDAAVSTIIAAKRENKKTIVFGDYDCDGISATAILVKTLDILEYDVHPFLPRRMEEGYGMNERSVGRLLKEYPDVKLVVTVDNGINSVEETAFLRSKGIDVVVTDHHLPGDVLPDCPIVNPKVSSPKELAGLCGAGVAFMLANALILKAREEGLYNGGPISGPLMVLAGLATVTDIMPLRDQNRILVSEALKLFSKYAPLGLKELFNRVSRSSDSFITARDFGFVIGPRINASGRISDGSEALRLVLSKDREEARELARQVDLRNMERKGIEQDMVDAALLQIVKGAAAQVIVLPDGHQGVAGIVAARVLEKISDESPLSAVPVAVLVGDHGSARAPEGYNVRDALAASSEALLRFGGHAAAAGFSLGNCFALKCECIDLFRKLFTNACLAQAEAMFQGDEYENQVDAWVTPNDMTIEFVDSFMRMEPFGEENPEPVFAFKNVCFSDVRVMGVEGRHLQLGFPGGLRAVWWNKGSIAEELRSRSHLTSDVMFKASVSTYGDRHVELTILSVKTNQDDYEAASTI